MNHKAETCPGPFVLAGCPTLKIPPGWDEDGEPYWTIHSQADADLLKTCPTFTGLLIIYGSQASGPFIVDGLKHIKGKLKVELIPRLDPRLTFFSMKSLVSIDGDLHISQGNLVERPSPSNLTTLDFPMLKSSSRFFDVRSLPNVLTIHMPRLERAAHISLFNMQSLRTLHVPKLKFLADLDLSHLPALKTLSFDAGIRDTPYFGGYSMQIRETALESISRLYITWAQFIEIDSNKEFTSLSLLHLKLVAGREGSRYSSVWLHNNGENFHLDIPRLKTMEGRLTVSDVHTVHVPRLQHAGDDINLGAAPDQWAGVLNHSTTMTRFSAPQLTKICGSLNIDNSPQLTDIDLPHLTTMGGDVRINNTAAVNLRTGVQLPRLQRVHSLQVIGTDPYCEGFDDIRDRGATQDRYWCGMVEKWTAEELRAKLWRDMVAIDACRNGVAAWCCVLWSERHMRSKVRTGVIFAALVMAWYVRRRYKRRLVGLSMRRVGK